MCVCTKSTSLGLELLECLGDLLLALDLDDVEADGLGERSALADDDSVALSHVEARGAVGGDVRVALLVTVVLWLVVEVVSADDDGSFHLGGLDDAREDSASDGDIGGERALLVDVAADDSSLGGLEAVIWENDDKNKLKSKK